MMLLLPRPATTVATISVTAFAILRDRDNALLAFVNPFCCANVCHRLYYAVLPMPNAICDAVAHSPMTITL